MPSLQKSSEKGYRIYWRLHYPNGTYKEKYKTSKSKTIANELLHDIAKIEVLSRRNELSPEDAIRAFHLKLISREELSHLGPKMQDPLDHYLHDLRADFETKSKAETSSPYCHKVNLYRANTVEKYFEDIPIRKITPEHVEQFIAHRKKTVTNTTVNHDLKTLRKYLDIAVHKSYADGNASREVKLLREPRGRVPRCLYPDEIKLFFDKLESYKHLLYGEFSFIIRCLIHTGLRRSELCDLKPENIKLHIRKIQVIGKGKKARVVGIHHSLIEDFDERIKRGYILPPTIHPTSITRVFKTIWRELGLPEAITLHSLRHTYISYLLEKGISAKRVQELAGHFSLSITDNYSHLIPNSKIEEDVLDFQKV